MLNQGCTLRHMEAPELLHIGGVSWWLSRAAKSGWNELANTFSDSDLYGEQSGPEAKGQDQDTMLKARRRGRSRWFAAWLLYLYGWGPKPLLQLSDRA